MLRFFANQDFSMTLSKEFVGDFASIEESILTVVSSMGSLVSEMQNMAEQVEMAALGISETGTEFNANFSSMVSTMEGVADSIQEVAQQARQNAEEAAEIHRLSESVRNSAEDGNNKMGQLSLAMNDIKDSSEQISSVVKAINSIAIQTNLLAINATIEAASAGEHGKGFQVVAEEVRNLATRSSAAVKETNNMIQNSLLKVDIGFELAKDTAEALANIVDITNQESAAVLSISRSSEAQVEGVEGITRRIEELYSITSGNSDTLSHNASISEELASLAISLKELVLKFKVR